MSHGHTANANERRTRAPPIEGSASDHPETIFKLQQLRDSRITLYLSGGNCVLDRTKAHRARARRSQVAVTCAIISVAHRHKWLRPVTRPVDNLPLPTRSQQRCYSRSSPDPGRTHCGSGQSIDPSLDLSIVVRRAPPIIFRNGENRNKQLDHHRRNVRCLVEF